MDVNLYSGKFNTKLDKGMNILRAMLNSSLLICTLFIRLMFKLLKRLIAYERHTLTEQIGLSSLFMVNESKRFHSIRLSNWLRLFMLQHVNINDLNWKQKDTNKNKETHLIIKEMRIRQKMNDSRWHWKTCCEFERNCATKTSHSRCSETRECTLDWVQKSPIACQ